MDIRFRLNSLIFLSVLGISGLMTYSQTASANTSTATTDIDVTISEESGDAVYVDISLDCSGAIGAYEYTLTYDPATLNYNSGSGHLSSDGRIRMASVGDGKIISSVDSYYFTKIGDGDISIQVTNIEMYDFDEHPCYISGDEGMIDLSCNDNISSIQTGPTLVIGNEQTGEDDAPHSTAQIITNSSDIDKMLETKVITVPKDATQTVVIIDNVEVTAYADSEDLYVVAQDEDGDVSLYIYDDGQNELLSVDEEGNLSQDNSDEATTSGKQKSDTKQKKTVTKKQKNITFVAMLIGIVILGIIASLSFFTLRSTIKKLDAIAPDKKDGSSDDEGELG